MGEGILKQVQHTFLKREQIMLNNLKDLLGISDPERLCLLDKDLFKNLPISIMWKDRNSVYLGGNDYLANLLGLKKGDDLIKRTDFDLSWSASAENFRLNDKQVIHQDKALTMLEAGVIGNKTQATAISYKFPLRLRTKKIAGIICVAIQLDNNGLIQTVLTDNKTLDAKSKFDSLDSITGFNLTRRQKECVYYLTRGMSIKQIANVLKLSPRTVEHYLEAARDRLGCHSRAQLIEKILDEK
jgi:DNA-binding CsgD family transcriptional regulator